MDLLSFLATIILITSVVSLVMAFAAYLAYKIRNARKPVKHTGPPTSVSVEPIFLKPSTLKSQISRQDEKSPDGI